MGLFSRSELPSLLAPPALPCISVLLPAFTDKNHRKGKTAQNQYQQQFQQAVNSVLQQLSPNNESDGTSSATADFLRAMEATQQQVARSNSYGAGDALTSGSLAIFYAPGFLRYYRLPGYLIESVKVSESFHLKPLLPLLTQGELFYVLAFGQSQVRLLQGSRQSLRPIGLQELPEALTAAMALDQVEPSICSERLIASRAIARPPVDDDLIEREVLLKQQMHQRCKQLAEQLDRFLKSQNVPLLLAGMPNLLSTYRALNPTSTMLNTSITGNLDTMKLEELHQQAWSRVQELVSSEREQALRQYQQAIQNGSASNHLGEIITKAINGKVKTLFISSSFQKWGKFNPYTWEVDVHCRPERGDIDLTQFAVEQTLLYGGSVYVMHPNQLASRNSTQALDQKTGTSKNDQGGTGAFETIAAIWRSK